MSVPRAVVAVAALLGALPALGGCGHDDPVAPPSVAPSFAVPVGLCATLADRLPAVAGLDAPPRLDPAPSDEAAEAAEGAAGCVLHLAAGAGPGVVTEVSVVLRDDGADASRAYDTLTAGDAVSVPPSYGADVTRRYVDPAAQWQAGSRSVVRFDDTFHHGAPDRVVTTTAVRSGPLLVVVRARGDRLDPADVDARVDLDARVADGALGLVHDALVVGAD